MWVMAVAARQQALVHAVMNGLGKLRLHLQVATVAEHGLGHGQQCALHFRVVRGVAVDTADIVLQVL